MRVLTKALLISLTFLLFCLSSATVSRADSVTLSNTDTGWYNDQGFHDAINKNYLAGSITVGPDTRTFHNFFVFNLTGVTGTVTGAQLHLFTATVTGSGTFSLFDVTTAAADLSASHTTRTDIFDDLGAGVSYGSTIITPADNGTLITINLSSAAIAAIQSHSGGVFAVGGFFDTAPGTFAFGGSTADVPDPRNELVVQTAAVPEPTTMLLLGTGLAGIVLRKRKRRIVKLKTNVI